MASHTYIQSKNVCVFSYNSRGFSIDKKQLCKTLMLNSETYFPILCNQENFLLYGNRFKVKQCLPHARIIFKKAVKELNEGRPKNGRFIAIPGEIKECLKDVSLNHWRVQAVILKTKKSKLLVINTYFPTHPKLKDFDTEELLTTLAAIKNTIETNEFENVLWAGDINADFLRQTRFTELVESFVNEESLIKSWDNFSIDFTHLFEVDDVHHTSTIDHFFWKEKLSNSIVEADVLHLPDNTSNHCPIYCQINIENLFPTELSPPNIREPKPCWEKANIEQKEDYKRMLQESLKSVEVPTHISVCQNVHCENDSHNNECDDLLLSVMEKIKSATDERIPSPKRAIQIGKRSPILRWNEEIKPFKDNAYFWHSSWQSAGRPLNTELHRIRKKTRNLYHFQIRKNRKMADIIKKNTLLDACVNNNGDIFNEIVNLRRSVPTVPSMIDDVTSGVENHC